MKRPTKTANKESINDFLKRGGKITTLPYIQPNDPEVSAQSSMPPRNVLHQLSDTSMVEVETKRNSFKNLSMEQKVSIAADSGTIDSLSAKYNITGATLSRIRSECARIIPEVKVNQA